VAVQAEIGVWNLQRVHLAVADRVIPLLNVQVLLVLTRVQSVESFPKVHHLSKEVPPLRTVAAVAAAVLAVPAELLSPV
jgi:hypothetical protein